MSLASFLLAAALAQSAPPAPEGVPVAGPTAAPAPITEPATPPRAPRFAKMAVGSCGCSLYAPPGLEFGAPEKSPDNADVWSGEVTTDGWAFGAVVVKFVSPMVATPDELEELLVSYTAFLRGQLGVVSNAGVGRGHTMPDHAAARGVIDYWKDKDGDEWAIKGWVDAERLAVLFVRGKGTYPYLTAQQVFLDGFRFE